MTHKERRKLQLKREMEEAQLFEQLGQKVIRVKTRTLKAIGDHLQACGVRTIGHGRIVVSGENADRAFVRCGEYVEQLAAKDPLLARDAIVELMRLQAIFNKQILECGEAHLKADRLPDVPQKGLSQPQAFPPGGVAVFVNAAPAAQPPALPPLET